MTDESNVPMNEPPTNRPQWSEHSQETPAGGSWPPPPAPGPTTWGSAPQGWPPPPIPPTPPPGPGAQYPPGPQPGQQYAPPPGPQYGQQYGAPGQPYGTAAGEPTAPGGTGGPPPDMRVGPPGGSWSYNYGPANWGPPPATPSQQSPTARRVIIGIAVAVLVLASGGVGAAVSSAVHSGSNNTAANSPFSGGGANNGGANNGGLGFGGLGNGNGNGNGNGGLGTGNGNGGLGTGNGLGNGGGLGTGNGTNSGSGTSTGSGAQASPAIVAKVDPGVVDIYTTINSGSSQGEAAGTGMILTSSGEVLTNNHVIDGASTIKVQIVQTGKTYTADVLGYSVVDDVALLQMENASDLNTVSLADGASVGVGDSVVAIGNAGGKGGLPAATAGSVTALDQKVTAGDEGTGDSETLHGMIQISAPIQPGDSGGPLVNTDGKIIGMNTAAAQSDDFFGQSGSTTAFAIPIDKAMQVVTQIRAGNNSSTIHVGDRGILGVQIQSAGQGGAAPTTSGAAIIGVQSGGPADSAGLNEGDVITSVNGKSVSNASDLTAEMFSYHPNDKVEIDWVDTSGNSHHATLQLVPGPPT
jgi:S1-C subfamily serine protease